MRHDLQVEGFRFRLRPVVEADAAFIVGLRTDPQLGRYLHETSPRVEDQVAWIRAYEDRPDDYYFVVEDGPSHEPVGAIGIYDIDRGTGRAEWGRWLIRKDSAAALESVVLVHRAGFEALDLRTMVSCTILENEQVVSFHRSFGANLGRTLPAHFAIRGAHYDAVEYEVSSESWTALRTRLERMTSRLAGR
jgi:RimJ/RimL family protein N-acetyltransferase